MPNALRKEIDILNRVSEAQETEDEEFDSGDAAVDDFYEYEETVAEEEKKKNRRFDPVENYEYQIPDEIEESADEVIESDDDVEEENNDKDEDGGRHLQMLLEITGFPDKVFEGKRKKNEIVISEAYPESEYNPSRDILEGANHISFQDLLDPLHGQSGFSKLRKNMDRVERNAKSLYAPLPRPDQERLERQAAHEFMKKDITKWEPLVKRNREAPTIYFDEDIDVGFSTVGAIASEFEPRTDFEKKIASLVNDSDIVEAHQKDGTKLLELNKVSIEDVKDRQDQLAKMRSLLFRHEMKAKRIKKIKSKAYHRLLKKDRLKGTAAAMEMDPEADKEFAMKQEFKRAEERLTLKHKNSSKWAKRILKRGLNAQDEGTRAAIAEQLQEHARLTRKMNSMKDSSDDDDSGETSADSDQDGRSTLLRKAKEKTLEVLEGDEEMPKSGVLSLPFMTRGLKKRKEAADEEARLALQDYELSLNQLEEKNYEESKDNKNSSGRMVFGSIKKQAVESTNEVKSDNYYGNSDSEEDLEAKEGLEDGQDQRKNSQRDATVNLDCLREESRILHDPLFHSFEDITRDPGPKTSYEVAICAPSSQKKKKILSSVNKENGGVEDDKVTMRAKKSGPTPHDEVIEDAIVDSDSDSGGEMVDGILSSGPESTYELPPQEELIRRAFAGDDVEEDFQKDKEEVLNEENPEPEKPVLLPGWGQWTHIQQKKGLPSWMVEEHENAKKKREEAIKKRKDARLNHVIISEKLDKKAEKLHTKTLPYPYTSKEVFEQSIRMPIGPEFNPATAIGALNRPEVVKKSGVIIKPIKFKDINPHEKADNHTNKRTKQQKSKSKSGGKANAKRNVT